MDIESVCCQVGGCCHLERIAIQHQKQGGNSRGRWLELATKRVLELNKGLLNITFHACYQFSLLIVPVQVCSNMLLGLHVNLKCVLLSHDLN